MSDVRIPAPTARTRTIVLLGNPVAHSLSPTFQTAAFAASDCDGIYLALRCDPADVKALLRGIAHAGGGGNVTIPHKEAAAQAIDVGTTAVERTGACNTFWLQDGRIHGDNTDVEGVRHALRHVGAAIDGGRALVLGAGGAASAVLCALIDAGASRVDVRNRSADRADALRRRVDPAGNIVKLLSEHDDISDRRYDVIINATPLGRGDNDALPLDIDVTQAPGAVIDVVYKTGGTPFVQAAIARGIPALDGREMLIAQGAAAFERWWGKRAPVEVMRAALGL